jgi:hypothetical protein
MEAAGAALAASPWSGRCSREDGAFFIDGAGTEGVEVNRFLVSQGHYASVIRPVQQSLEEAFLEITGEVENV